MEELKRIAAGLPVLFFTLDDFPSCPDVVEDGAAFEENAVKKALSAARCSGKPALADDSGLEVAALGGAPGVLSARYAGEGADDSRNVEKLLSALRGVDKREARFVCCIAFALPDGKVHIFHGVIDGCIGEEPRGSLGFGYDPVFYPAGSSRTFAEMGSEEKDSVSHRGMALEEFRRFIEQRVRFGCF